MIDMGFLRSVAAAVLTAACVSLFGGGGSGEVDLRGGGLVRGQALGSSLITNEQLSQPGNVIVPK